MQQKLDDVLIFQAPSNFYFNFHLLTLFEHSILPVLSPVRKERSSDTRLLNSLLSPQSEPSAPRGYRYSVFHIFFVSTEQSMAHVNQRLLSELLNAKMKSLYHYIPCATSKFF